jgi:hypothetical protein
MIDRYPKREHISEFARLDYRGWLRAYGIDIDAVGQNAYDAVRACYTRTPLGTNDEVACGGFCLTAAPAVTNSLRRLLADNNMDMRAHTESHSIYPKLSGFKFHDFTVLARSQDRRPTDRDIVICSTYKPFMSEEDRSDLPNVMVGRRDAIVDFMAMYAFHPYTTSSLFAVQSFDGLRSRSQGTDPSLWSYSPGNDIETHMPTNPIGQIVIESAAPDTIIPG